MPDLKISQLTAGGAAQASDEFPIARAGGNNKITGANIAAAATSVGTLTSLTVSGSSGLQATFQGTSQGAIRIRGASAGYQIFSNAAGTLSFYDDNSAATRWTMNGNGHFLAGADATYDIGASGANRPRNIYTGSDAFLAGVRVGRGAGAISTNTVVGASALAANTTGTDNTAVGSFALPIATTGTQQTAVGGNALFSNTTGQQNTALGRDALYSNTTTSNNVACGRSALVSATAASNTALGDAAGSAITTGARNTLLGRYSGNQDGLDLRTANNNIVLSDGDGNARLYYDGASNFWAFRNDGTERMRVKSGGQVRFVPLATAPTTNVEDGDVYYDSGTNKLRVRAGGAWTDLH